MNLITGRSDIESVLLPMTILHIIPRHFPRAQIWSSWLQIKFWPDKVGTMLFPHALWQKIEYVKWEQITSLIKHGYKRKEGRAEPTGRTTMGTWVYKWNYINFMHARNFPGAQF